MKSKLVEIKLIENNDVEEVIIHKFQYAYPVIESDMEHKLHPVYNYLSSFDNLHILGRNAEFKYLHIHHLFKEAKMLVQKLKF